MASLYQLGQGIVNQSLQRDTVSSRGQLNIDVDDQKPSRFLSLDKGDIDCMGDERRLVVADLEQSNANNQYIT